MNWESWGDYLAGYFRALCHVWKVSEVPWDTIAYWVGAVGSVAAAFFAYLATRRAQAAAEDSRAAAKEAREDEAKRADAIFRRTQKDEALRLAGDAKVQLFRVQAEAAAVEAELNSFLGVLSQIGTIQGLFGRDSLNMLFGEVRNKRVDLEARLGVIEIEVLAYDPAASGTDMDIALQSLRQIKAETDALETYTRAATQDHRSRILRRNGNEGGASATSAQSDPPPTTS